MAVVKGEIYKGDGWSICVEGGAVASLSRYGDHLVDFESDIDALALAEVLAAPLGLSVASQVSAVRTLERMGYTHEGGELWKPPLGEGLDWDLVSQLKDKLKAMAAMFAEYGKKEPSLRSLCKYCKRADSCVAVVHPNCPDFLPTGWPYDE